MIRTTEKIVEVLLVEDNPGDVRLMMESLKEGMAGCHLSVVWDGEEASAFLRRQGAYSAAPRADIIVLDLNLPRKDGRELLAEIKTDPVFRRIPVVVLTSSNAEQDILKAYELHANCYIRKPVNLDEFLGVGKAIESFWLTVVTLPPMQDR